MNDPIVDLALGATLPVIAVRVLDAGGKPIPLDAVEDIASMTWQDPLDPTPSGTWVRPAIIVDGPGAVVAYQPTLDETGIPGEYLTRFTITPPSDDVLTAPNRGHLRVRVNP